MSGPALVAVTGRRRSAAGLGLGMPHLDGLEVEAYFSGYADRLAGLGALPVHVPFGVEPDRVLDRVDALVLTGGSDVDPALYGARPLATTSTVDRARDDRELALLAAALDHHRPVLAVCRGMQLLNVHLGGTLHQHLADHPTGADDTHEVRLAPGSRLGAVYGPSCRVNSLHHQAVAELGAGLTAVGTATDGVVEAVELDGFDVVGVQWHPEQLAAPDPVFDWLIGVASGRGARVRP